MFSTFLDLGFDHILDPKGYDHILFVMVLCALYSYQDWRKVLVLVTAFTVGHSITLALSSMSIISIDSDLVETLIPVTIILTGFFNIFTIFSKAKKELKINAHYTIALLFGTIHGLGFSNYFKALMGEQESIFEPLLAFNLGVELGQICIVLSILGIGYLLVYSLGLKMKYWVLSISMLAIVVATYLLLA